MNPLWLFLPTALAALATWSCWRESLRGDRYQAWMIEADIRADRAEHRADRLRLTDAEREAALLLIYCGKQSGDPVDKQAAATLRGFLKRPGGER